MAEFLQENARFMGIDVRGNFRVHELRLPFYMYESSPGRSGASDHMKTVLDLIQEFATLNDAKSCNGGNLPPASSERRWAELKAFCGRLRVQSGCLKRPRCRFAAAEIRRRVPIRTSLHVPVEMDLAVQCQGEYHTARVMNLSCGSALLASGALFEVGSRLTLYLAIVGRDSETFLVMEGDVVWRTELAVAESALRHRMDIRFVALSQSAQEKLDSFVVEILEKQLLMLDPTALDPDFVRREELLL